MTFLVVYESMFGNTREIAAAVARGLADFDDVRILAAAAAPDSVDVDDVLFVGAPTHAHGLPSARTRSGAPEMARKAEPPLTLEPDALGEGIREWLTGLRQLPARAAVFDTRADLPVLFAGSAARRISRRLQQRGVSLLVPPESFFVKGNRLVVGELDRAARWAAATAATCGSVRMPT